jgi:general secretion pathway protein G
MCNPKPVTPRSKGSFRPIDWVVVLAMVGFLIFEAMPGDQTDFWNKIYSETARTFVTNSIVPALKAYQSDMGELPSTVDGLAALYKAPAGKEDRWRGPYLSGDWPILDGWKQPFVYRRPGKHNKDGFDVFSEGPDRIPGTADDIGNW